MDFVKEQLNNINNLFYLCFVIIILLLLSKYLKQRKKTKIYKKQMDLISGVSKVLNIEKGLEKNLIDILDLIKGVIVTEKYTFYMSNCKSKNYDLIIVLYSEQVEKNIEPSYSGLLPFKKDLYKPSISIPMEKVTKKTCLSKDGESSIAVVPIAGGKGIIQCGPVHKISKVERMELDALGERLGPILQVLLEYESLRNQVEVIVASGTAIQNISNTITDYDAIIRYIVSVSIKTLGASGGLLMVEENIKDRFEIPISIGMEKCVEKQFVADHETHLLFKNLLINSNVCILKKGDLQYFRLPTYLAAADMKVLYMVNIQADKINGVVVFWYNKMMKNVYTDVYKLTALEVLAKKAGEVLNNRFNFTKLTDSYINMLKILVQMMDNSTPYTIGHAELMSKFATVICKEMKLEVQKIKSISLAAYLSDIGIMGLNTEILQIEGRFTELEYEVMKLHSDVGASIIYAIIPDISLAANIRHHHERMDGFGYPGKLKGAEIPLGAKIIAVVQTFLALITGRKERESLKFDKAFDLLHAAAGSQLDENIVNILIEWFKKKQIKALKSGRALGNCWEMRCSTPTICSQCPAFMVTNKNCWELGKNNCDAHGNNCNSCFIYTEYLNRNSLLFINRTKKEHI